MARTTNGSGLAGRGRYQHHVQLAGLCGLGHRYWEMLDSAIHPPRRDGRKLKSMTGKQPSAGKLFYAAEW